MLTDTGSRGETGAGSVRTLRMLFDAALSAADPSQLEFPDPDICASGRIVVVGAGKASAAMANRFEQKLGADKVSGLVVTPFGHGVPCRSIEVVEAAHPVPDEAGVVAARRILAIAEDLGDEDTLICLLSGGASSLLCLPVPGLVLMEKREISRQLLASGASISEINCVRKHISAIKGGRLAAMAFPARCHTWMISDVPNDEIPVIGSGPTVADPTRSEDAIEILDRYEITVPRLVYEGLAAGEFESPKPGDARLTRSTAEILVRPADALRAAADHARALDITPVVLGDAIEGEAREVAADMAEKAKALASQLQRDSAPVVMLSGGETTVTIRGSGRGGRNTEFLLALGIALAGDHRIHAIACDTDGIDGAGDNAGAILTPGSLTRLAERGLDARQLLDNNDGYRAFDTLGDLVVTGPTRTNVNDFRAILIIPEGAE